MPNTASTCPLDCPDACGVSVESDAEGRFVRLGGRADHGYSRGTLCGKTALYGDIVQSPDRLTTPLARDAAGELRPIAWDDAIALIAERVRDLPGESILAAHYAGSMGLIARKYPLRVMHALGATLTDGGICDNTATAGFEAVLGSAIGFDLERADECDFILLWGCDMKRTLQHLQPAVQRLAKRGGTVIAIDVYRTDTIRALENWGGRGLIVRPGSDAALALALTRIAFEDGFVDRRAIETECVGGAQYEQHARGFDLERAVRATGLDEAEIRRIASELARAERPLLKVGVGWTRRRNGGMSMRAVCSLAAVLGWARRTHYGSGACFALEEDCVDRPDLRVGEPPRVIRHIELGRELESGRYRAVFVWSHNPAVTCPDTRRVRAGLERDDVFSVVHEHFLTESAALADVVLPATTFLEHWDVYRSYGHRRLHLSRPAVAAPEGARSNVDTFAALGRALELPREVWDVDAESLCRELLSASSARFRDGDLERLEGGEAVKIEPPTTPRGREWSTPSGKIELYSETLAAAGAGAMADYVPDEGSDPQRAFWLVSAPSRHTHNSTFSHSPRHLAREGEAVCWIAAADAERIGCSDGERVTLANDCGRVSLPVRLSDELPRGCVRVDGLPRAVDVPERVGINALVSPEPSDIGDGNVLYSTRVDVAPAPSTSDA